MTDPDFAALLARVTRSSNRMRIAMVVTAALCALITAGISADPSVWAGGVGLRVAATFGVTFFAGCTALLLYGAFWRQRRHISRLRATLEHRPGDVRSIRVMVARAVPYAQWAPDDGVATRGLHVMIETADGGNWLLPLSRTEVAGVVAELRRRCPQATTGPG